MSRMRTCRSGVARAGAVLARALLVVQVRAGREGSPMFATPKALCANCGEPVEVRRGVRSFRTEDGSILVAAHDCPFCRRESDRSPARPSSSRARRGWPVSAVVQFIVQALDPEGLPRAWAIGPDRDLARVECLRQLVAYRHGKPAGADNAAASFAIVTEVLR